jgi:hypothetical protein
MLDKDFNAGEWAFCIHRTYLTLDSPRLKARIANKQTFLLTKFNKGGFVVDCLVRMFLLIVALIIYALTEYAVRRFRRELNEVEGEKYSALVRWGF